MSPVAPRRMNRLVLQVVFLVSLTAVVIITIEAATCENGGAPTKAARAASTALLLSGEHDLRFKGVTFDGAGSGYGDTSGVIEITGSSHNITFEDCTIMPNGDGVGNGVKIINVNGGIHDITFTGCHFMTQPRMGFECIDRSSTGGRGYRRVRLVNCTFEPQSSEAISFDDNSGTSGDCSIQNNVVEGAGAAILSTWGSGLEVNRVHNMRVIGNTFYACRDSVWNLTGPSGDCGWTFSHNTIDCTRVFGGIQMASTANCVSAVNVYGGVFPKNTITDAPPSWNVAYLSGCHKMDWRTTKWLDARGEAYSTPYQIDCSQNRF